MSQRVEVGAIRKADGAEIRVAIDDYKGRCVADIRLWFEPSGGGPFVPSGKGVTFDADKLPELARVIADAARLLCAES